MTCNFHVGQKVVCINDGWAGVSCPLIKGAVYTVSGISNGCGYYLPTNSIDTVTVVILAEVDNPGGVVGFHHARFRPVVTRKTDISIFKAMLDPSKQKYPHYNEQDTSALSKILGGAK